MRFDATLRVDQLRFTQDGRPVILWELEGRRVPIALEAVTEMQSSGSETSAIQRTCSSAALEVGVKDFESKAFLAGRSTSWRSDAPRLQLVGYDARTDTRWVAIRDHVEDDFVPWIELWRGTRQPDVDLAQVAELRRSFSIPGGLRQYAPPDGSESGEVVLALLDFVADCFATQTEANPGSATKSQPDSPVQFESRPDATRWVTVWWHELWAGDHGVRHVHGVKSNLAFWHRSTFVLERDPAQPSIAALRSAGSSRLHGEIEFTARNASWPAAWTCVLDVTLEWKTCVDWK